MDSGSPVDRTGRIAAVWFCQTRFPRKGGRHRFSAMDAVVEFEPNVPMLRSNFMCWIMFVSASRIAVFLRSLEDEKCGRYFGGVSFKVLYIPCRRI